MFTSWLRLAPMLMLMAALLAIFGLYQQNKLLAYRLSSATVLAAAKQSQIEHMLAMLDEERAAAKIIQEKLKRELTQLKDLRHLINDERIGNLFQKKPGLIMLRINAGTERMRQLFIEAPS